jgi:hypothetical protein
MAGKKQETSQPNQNSSPRMPSMTPEARESRMIALAMDQAEQELKEGRASSQVVTHFLKLGTIKEQLELERLEKENRLLEAKTKAYESASHSEELYMNAIKAFGIYSGNIPNDENIQ